MKCVFAFYAKTIVYALMILLVTMLVTTSTVKRTPAEQLINPNMACYNIFIEICLRFHYMYQRKHYLPTYAMCHKKYDVYMKRLQSFCLNKS